MKKEINLLLGRIKWNTYRFANKLDRELLANGVPKAQLKNDRRKYLYKIDNFMQDTKIYQQDVRIFVSNVKSYEEAFKYLSLTKKAKSLKLDKYFNFKKINNLLLKNKTPDFYYKLAKFFKNFDLEEDGQGDFGKLISYIDIHEGDLELIVDTLIYTKNAGCPLSQKDIVKFYDSNRPFSEDLLSLKEAWIFAHEHKIPVTIKDFIQAIKYERYPHQYVVNYNKIITSDLPIPYEKFKIFNVPQAKIGELINLMIKSKIAEILLDFEILYDDIKLKRDVWSIMRYLIKFNDSGFDSVDYTKLKNYLLFGGKLDKLHEAFLYNRKRKIIKEDVFFDRITEILLVKNENSNFNSLSCIKALELAYSHATEETQETGKKTDKEEIANEVFNDYLAGFDVYEVVNYIKYAKSHDIIISYNVAKLLNQNSEITFKDAIFNALNPVILKDYKPSIDGKDKEINQLKVTTKDNIEILINMEMEAVLLPNNYFKGSDEKILFQRANAILINEIQRKYNHDEIILNIEKISNNVLFRLMEETRDIDIKYIPEDKMTKANITEHGHGGHNANAEHSESNHKEDKHKITELKNHSEEHHEKENLEKKLHHSNEHHEEEHHSEKQIQLNEDDLFVKSDNTKQKFITVSKYKPLKVIIPKIDFVKDTFKDFEKAKAEFEHHKHEMHLKMLELEAKIENKKAWSKDDNIKFKFLESEDDSTIHGHLGH